jgi:uncharacterized membrane protein YedE/YeeE
MLSLMDTFFPNGWAHYLVGGLCIGLGVSLMFVVQGRVVGMSSLFTSTWSYFSKKPHFQQLAFTQSRQWRLVCALGLVLGAWVWFLVWGPALEVTTTHISAWRLLLGGLIAGFGARLSNGCTSGHGICGLSSLSWPALVAVLVFMAVASATALTLSFLGGTLA